MSVSVKFHNLAIVIEKIKVVGKGAPRYMQALLDKAMNDDIYPLWVKQISMNDHSLEDLRKLGHPYSTKFSKDSFVHPDDVVHVQDGNLLGSSIIERGEGFVRLVNDSPEYAYLRYGTTKMRMRDPGGEAMKEALPKIQQRFKDGVRHAVIQYFKG